MTKILWTEEEDETLREVWGKSGNRKTRVNDLLVLFPNRTYPAIKKHAQLLDLTSRERFWSDEEENIFRDLYYEGSKEEILAHLPKRNWTSIVLHAFYKGVERNSRVYRNKYSVNYGFFDEPNILNCYYAGLLAADGYIYLPENKVGISLNSRDENTILSFIKDVDYTGIAHTYKSKGTYKSNGYKTQVDICGVPEWVDALGRNFNITPRKTLTLQPPNIQEKAHIIAFLVGNIDGDGTIAKKSRSVFFHGTKELLEWVKNFFDTYCPPVVNNVKPAKLIPIKTIWKYGASGKRILPFLEEVRALNIPKMKRKWEKIL